MAPVHRKGGIQVKVKEKVKELEPGDLVLCKIKGLRQWPGKIIRPEDWEQMPDPEKLCVKFFGTSEIAFVAPADIRLFTSASKRKLLALRHSKVFKYFCSAVDEICEAFENQLKKNSSDPVEVNDGKSVPLVLTSDASCLKEENSISAYPCITQQNEKEAQQKSPVVNRGKPLDGNEGDVADLVDNEPLALVLSKNAQELQKPEKVIVCEKQKAISEPKVDVLREKKKRKRRRCSKVYTEGGEKSDAPCEVKDLQDNGPRPDVHEDNGSKVNMTATTERSGAATTSSLSRGLLHDNLISGPVLTPVVHGTTAPSTASAIHMLTSGSSVHTYPQDFVASASFGPSPKPSHQISSTNQGEIYECDITRHSRGSHEGSLSCGADATVACETLEGMMDTLSRAKESIGRATHLAIGCAKYGIASEVIDLIIRKLEGESNFRRKVDLFFLVDSITQCSHIEKGIAGASYIPAVQAALPRLLGAAVPSGASACENRHQCLKVLRLWAERKIMPEAVLHQYMHYLEAPKDERNSCLFLPAVDDPIRKMGVLVDENGRNSGKELMVESDIASKTGNCVFATREKGHHILKDVDGEVEMEDVCMVSEEEKGVLVSDSNRREPCQFYGGSTQSSVNNLAEAQPISMGPILPLDYPPPPRLVPPPPPLPLSPPPLPPPPPKSSPPPPGFPPPRYFPPPGPSVPPSLMYCPPIAQEHCRPPCCNQGAQMTGNVAIHGHGTVSANVEGVLLQPPTFGTTNLGTLQPMPGFTPRPCEYGRNDMYLTSGHSHNPQFQSSSGSFQQGPYHSLLPWQAPTNYPQPTVQAPPNYPLPNHPLATAQSPPNHPLPTAETQMNSFSFVNPLSQQNYHQPYGPYSHAYVGVRGQNVLDKQRRVHSTDFISDGHNGVCVAGGGGTSSSGVPFPQDGFYRSNMERPHQNSVYQHPPLHNSMPSGPSVRVPLSHVHPHHFLPSDVPALNWRSA